jgi:hypothetical protein
MRPPGRDDFTKISTPDPSTPTAKNPIIQVSGDSPKKDSPAKVDTPPMLDAPPKIEPPPMLKVETPKADPKLDAPANKVETPRIDFPLDPPTKMDLPARKIEPATKIEAPLDPPAKKEPLAKIDLPAFDPPLKQTAPPATAVDFTPAKQNDPPAAATLPKADVKKEGDYDEDMHSLKQNETYRSISKQYYNSDAYAIALQRYNRDNPGQADYVRIPPIWLLEKKYADDITANQARPVNYTPTAAEPTPRNEPVYTVADNGEMLADVARKQLGTEDAWKRIWDLNPQINPAKTIPGGTRLRLPGQ